MLFFLILRILNIQNIKILLKFYKSSKLQICTYLIFLKFSSKLTQVQFPKHTHYIYNYLIIKIYIIFL